MSEIQSRLMWATQWMFDPEEQKYDRQVSPREFGEYTLPVYVVKADQRVLDWEKENGPIPAVGTEVLNSYKGRAIVISPPWWSERSGKPCVRLRDVRTNTEYVLFAYELYPIQPTRYRVTVEVDSEEEAERIKARLAGATVEEVER